MVVLENDSHIKVLHAECDSLEVNGFDVLDVDDIEGELADGDKAELGGSDLDYGF